MRTTESVEIDAPPSTVFPHVVDLTHYPTWLPLVHEAVRCSHETGDDAPAWEVELRARVGPFARSKRLRMRRSAHVVDRLAVFERDEDDGRDHSPWILRAELSPDPSDATPDPTTRLTMTMTYGGSLWAGPVLERVLDEQVRLGSDALLQLVS